MKELVSLFSGEGSLVIDLMGDNSDGKNLSHACARVCVCACVHVCMCACACVHACAYNACVHACAYNACVCILQFQLM